MRVDLRHCALDEMSGTPYHMIVSNVVHEGGFLINLGPTQNNTVINQLSTSEHLALN